MTACAGTAKVHVASPPDTATTTPVASESPTPTPTPTPTATKPGPILTDGHTVALGFTVTAVVPAGPVVYAVGGDSETVTVARIDVAAKSVTAQRSFPGDTVRASVGGGALAVLVTGHSTTIARLDLRTLAVTAERTLAVRAAGVLARPEATYVSTPGSILVLDPATLQTRHGIVVDNDPQQGAYGAEIAADPRSHILYAGIPSSSHPLIDVVDLRTGRILARPRVPAVVVAEPQGYGDDSWAVFATGMMAAAELLTPTGHVRTTLAQIGPNTATIAVTGLHLWTFAPSFHQNIQCRDLSHGAIEGSEPDPAVGMVTAADDTHVYLGGNDSLSIYTPGGACA